MRKTGINIDDDVIYGVEPLTAAIATAGFDAVFTSGKDAAFVKKIAALCKQYGLAYESLHAPFADINDMWSRGPRADAMLQSLCDSVDLAAAYGIPVVVSHLSSGDDCPPVTDAGRENFDHFIQYAKAKHIVVALENQRKLGNIAMMLEIYQNDPAVGFCWDVGHEACFAYGREYMPLFGDRCVYTHIHDNHKAHNGDEHLLPFDGAIDYQNVARRLVQAGYDGTLTLEIRLPVKDGEPYAALSAPQFAAKAYAAVNRIRTMCEEVSSI